MLTWVGFVARLLDFVLTKIVGRKVDFALDERKRAARAFLDLCDAVDEIVALTEIFLARLQPIVDGEKSRIFSAWLAPIAGELDHASNAFVQALSDLQRVIAIYDPQLSGMLSNIRESKAEILAGISLSGIFATGMRFQITEGKRLKAIEYTMPTEEAMGADFEGMYRAFEELLESRRRTPAEWPVDSLTSFVRDRMIVGSVTPTSVDEIRALHRVISEYLPLLVSTSDRLGQFIRERFTIEDLLYVRRRIR